jgi:hypothetical protein
VQLQRSKKAEQEGTSDAGNYVAHCKRIVEGAKAALAVDTTESHNGQLVQVFPMGSAKARRVK